MKSAWIQAQGRSYPLWDMCYVLSVSISGYRAWCRGGKADRVQLSSAQALAHCGQTRAALDWNEVRTQIEQALTGLDTEILGLENTGSGNNRGDQKILRVLHLTFESKLPPFFQRQATVAQPVRVDRHKRMLARQHDGVALALAFGMRIDVPLSVPIFFGCEQISLDVSRQRNRKIFNPDNHLRRSLDVSRHP